MRTAQLEEGAPACLLPTACCLLFSQESFRRLVQRPEMVKSLGAPVSLPAYFLGSVT